MYPSKTIEDISNFLFIESDETTLENIDLVIVLGNNLIDDTVKKVYELYKEHKIIENAKIILTGDRGLIDKDDEKECIRLYNCAVNKYNMPKNIFILEDKATNTLENFANCKKIIENIGGFESFNNILIIGKTFLIRRCMMYAGKFNYPKEKLKFIGTVDEKDKNISKTDWWKQENSLKRVAAELERIGKYIQKGDLDIFNF